MNSKQRKQLKKKQVQFIHEALESCNVPEELKGFAKELMRLTEENAKLEAELEVLRSCSNARMGCDSNIGS